MNLPLTGALRWMVLGIPVVMASCGADGGHPAFHYCNVYNEEGGWNEWDIDIEHTEPQNSHIYVNRNDPLVRFSARVDDWWDNDVTDAEVLVENTKGDILDYDRSTFVWQDPSFHSAVLQVSYRALSGGRDPKYWDVDGYDIGNFVLWHSWNPGTYANAMMDITGVFYFPQADQVLKQESEF